MYDILAMVRRVIDEYDDRMLAGELYLPLDKAVSYYGKAQPEFLLPFNLQLAWSEWNAEGIGEMIESSVKVAIENDDPSSLLNLYRRLIALRRDNQP